jgi:hypothetical protein
VPVAVGLTLAEPLSVPLTVMVEAVMLFELKFACPSITKLVPTLKTLPVKVVVPEMSVAFETL